MVKAKGFSGPSINLYNNLHQIGSENIYIYKAGLKNQIVAGIMVIKSGNSCIYQVGWNSTQGRRLNANNNLLWNAIVHMKSTGCKWFDLGGIDEAIVPGITKFKRGTGGQEYNSIGEWLSF